MPDLVRLQTVLESVRQLKSIVTSMKTLAMINSRIYEAAVRSAETYRTNVERGLQVVVSEAEIKERAASNDGEFPMYVVIGTDQGMCGPYNDRLVDRVEELHEQVDSEKSSPVLIGSGERLHNRMEERGFQFQEQVALPGDEETIMTRVKRIVPLLDQYRRERNISSVEIVYNWIEEGSSVDIKTEKLLPVDTEWLADLRSRSWPGRSLPHHRGEREVLFSNLISQMISITLFRAFARSLSAENETRYRTMVGAEENIQEKLKELEKSYSRERQQSITEELLDIISGYDAQRKSI